MLKRKPRQNHFNAKDTGASTMGKRGKVHAPAEYANHFRALLPDHL
ncbi:MAG TPA: hypothetical protein VD862_04810 [Candidatus Paceibacterota bacterium]|nr:hypothetical protein [Candidatus Paceibacterota bacterium]